MNLRILMTLFICLLSGELHAQGVFEGRVTNHSDRSMEGVQIDVLHTRDSTLVVSTLTDENGDYHLENVPGGSYWIRASYLGCKPMMKRVMLLSGVRMTVDFRLTSTVVLDEVKVVGTGITMKGDTTTYVVGRFTTGNERNLREVLEKLPNVKVDESTHTITANGRQVSRILLEDQDLFQGNMAVPMENLSADGVSKVEVINNYSEYDIFNGFRTSNETVLNVKVTDRMHNKLRGELEMAGGVEERYNARNTSLYIGRKSMLSAIVNSNNIGKQLLRFQDIVKMNGGYSSLLSTTNPMDAITQMMETYEPFLDNRNDVYKNNNTLASLNYVIHPSDKLKIAMNGIYGINHYRTKSEKHYEYLSGEQYDESLREKSSLDQMLVNLKMQYVPHKDFNLFYTGNLLYADRDKTIRSDRLYSRLHYMYRPNTLSVNNNLLVVKRFGRHSLNMSLDYNNKEVKGGNCLSDTLSPTGVEEVINTSYCYDTRHREEQVGGQLFYLHRLDENYFLRIGLQSTYARHTFDSNMESGWVTHEYDNDLFIDHTDNGLSLKLNKDRGKFTFTGGIDYRYLHLHTNRVRPFQQNAKHVWAPMLRMDYAFTQMHRLSFDYDYSVNNHPITSLTDHSYLQGYDRIISSTADRFFFSRNRVSLQEVLILPMMGVTLINIASFSSMKDGLVDNHSLWELTNLSEKRILSGTKTFSWLSTFEYKFLGLPLNARLSLNYNHHYMPVFNDDELYKSRLNRLGGQFRLATFYKKGFNGKLQADVNRSNYHGLPVKNELWTHTLMGSIAWNNSRLYASGDVRFRRYHQSTVTTRNLYYGLEMRYKLTPEIQLQCSAIDMLHLSERIQASGIIDSYYAVNSRVWYMPGSILCGVTVKY